MNTPVALSLDLLPANVAARIAYFVAHAGQGYYTHDDADAADEVRFGHARETTAMTLTRYGSFR